MIAGYVDGYGLVVFSTFLSFMSGNTTQTGTSLGEGMPGLALPSAVAIGAFLVGVVLGNLRTRSEGRQRSVLVVVALWLGAVCAGLKLGVLRGIPAIAMIACAMGLLNTAIARVGNEPVNLTFVTGALNRLGAHIAGAIKRRPLDDAMGSWDTHAGRAALLGCVWTAFLFGAVLAGLATGRLGEWTLAAPAALILVIAALFEFVGENDRVRSAEKSTG